MRGSDPKRTRRSRLLRQADNDAEALMWSELRDRRLNGFKFVRQLPIDRYFADFACRSEQLVVEVDGSQHAESKADAIRDQVMNDLGWSIARFWNVDVLKDRSSVAETLVEILEGRLCEETKSAEFTFKPGKPMK